MRTSFEQRLTTRYGDLTDTLRAAAEYIMHHPLDMATRPLRTVAQASGSSPAAFTRLSKALGYTGLDELREELRDKIDQRMGDFASRAQRLQEDHGAGKSDFMTAHLSACQTNLQTLPESVNLQLLDQAIDTLARARVVSLLGALGSTGVVEYMAYMANMFAGNWQLLGRMGASLGSGLANMTKDDALVVVTKPPFAPQVLRAVEIARNQGAYVVVITDTHACPALRHAQAGFVLPSASPHFYSSYVSTMFLVEVIIGKLVSHAGEKARLRIANVEDSNRLLSEVLDEDLV
ncbi:MurR/RpiR family transcriptional regulator [Aliiroseovarius sp. KMU-50]|uniref:MurR/RpiR family transcriptional regulator n=1 Tax=Aliiroseovarius salicola TaxID=3009082 RepID=A0ABT4VWM9_9RHOB|nr:MurR/RpiR family transcriptional regulator [Aliiroseovarius sp. KMU-50]MDA5092652.1 MurR/RpiR family transcriptional regulator [Aliiroseovarius sp. KMU-50]